MELDEYKAREYHFESEGEAEEQLLRRMRSATECVEDGDHLGALKLYRRARAQLVAFEQLETVRGAGLLTKIGFSLLRQGAPKEALDEFMFARRILEEEGVLRSSKNGAKLLALIGEAKAAANDLEGAIVAFGTARRARELTNSLKSADGAMVLVRLGDVYIKQGGAVQIEKAVEVCEIACRILAEFGALTTTREGALAQISLGDARLKQPRGAKEALAKYRAARRSLEASARPTDDESVGSEEGAGLANEEGAELLAKIASLQLRLEGNGDPERQQFILEDVHRSVSLMESSEAGVALLESTEAGARLLMQLAYTQLVVAEAVMARSSHEDGQADLSERQLDHDDTDAENMLVEEDDPRLPSIGDGSVEMASDDSLQSHEFTSIQASYDAAEDRAVEFLDRARRALVAADALKSSTAAEVLTMLGTIYAGHGNYDIALSRLKGARRAREATKQLSTSEGAELLQAIGDMHAQIGDEGKALHAYESARDVRARVDGPDEIFGHRGESRILEMKITSFEHRMGYSPGERLRERAERYKEMQEYALERKRMRDLMQAKGGGKGKGKGKGKGGNFRDARRVVGGAGSWGRGADSSGSASRESPVPDRSQLPRRPRIDPENLDR